MKIQIGKHEVGDGCKPFIICEIGSNWRTFEDCKNSISLAKQCGADAVKFQLFKPEDMYGVKPVFIKAYDPKIRDTIFETPYLDPDWLPKLAEKAKACDIEFMCSAFSPELIDVVDPYVNVHKVASAELTHIRMLEKLRKIGKPVILSTGASGLQDIENAIDVLQPTATREIADHGTAPVILMYCVAAYPARRISTTAFADFCDRFPGTLIGFSDHSLDTTAICGALNNMGACVFEKHVNFVGVDSPDAEHSLSMDEFKEMVMSIKTGVGPRWNGPTPEEKPMILRHNRRLIATRDIAPGEMLKEGENFGIYRSLKDDTYAFSPWMIDQVNGKVALKSIRAGDGIGPGNV